MSSVIRQKRESQNVCFKKTKQLNFPEKTSISYPLIRKRALFGMLYLYPLKTTEDQTVRECNIILKLDNMSCHYILITHLPVQSQQ